MSKKNRKEKQAVQKEKAARNQAEEKAVRNPAEEKTAQKPAEEKELKLANRLSGRMHGGMSKIRLSLTFRIAALYCLQLVRSFIPSAILVLVLFAGGLSIPVSRRLNKMETAAITAENPAVDGIVTGELTETIPEQRFFPRFGQQVSRIFSGSLNDGKLQFFYSSRNHGEMLVTVQIGDILVLAGFVLLGLLGTDLFRMIYFFRHENRLNKRVLAPIRDIAGMAATLSENNLSNRINIAGTKNELKDLASVINTMLDRIERSYNSQKQFVSDASHELRTPIAVIRGYTDMLKRWGKDDPEVLDEGIAAISQETESMKELVESLLFLARHDKKTLMMEKSVFDVPELLQEVQKEEAIIHEEHQFDLQIADSFTLNADRNMIKQVLRILSDNAVKYSGAGTTVTLGCRKGGDGRAELLVSDQGSGIKAEDISKIFERFYRSESARKTETSGHGLGLSIARIIVVAHEGKIKVRSKEGAGTTFILSFPAQQPGAV